MDVDHSCIISHHPPTTRAILQPNPPVLVQRLSYPRMRMHSQTHLMTKPTHGIHDFVIGNRRLEGRREPARIRRGWSMRLGVGSRSVNHEWRSPCAAWRGYRRRRGQRGAVEKLTKSGHGRYAIISSSFSLYNLHSLHPSLHRDAFFLVFTDYISVSSYRVLSYTNTHPEVL